MAEHEVIELRVHGVGGPTPASVLETVEPIPIGNAETELAGFYRRERPGPSGQRVEAFVWGGLTSKAAVQAAWWLLLPFALVNVAGWMVRPNRRGGEEPGRTVAWWIRFLLTVGGGFVTVLYLAWSAVLLVDVTAYQCGAQPDCVNRSWLLPLRWLDGHPMWRITVGGVGVAATLLALLAAAKLSHERYEEFEPDAVRRRMASRAVRSMWARNDGLRHPLFWYNWREWRSLFLWHAYVGLAVVAALIGYSMAVANRSRPFVDAPSWGPALAWSIVFAGVVLVVFARLLAPPAYDDAGPFPHRRAVWSAASVGALVVAALAFWAAWSYHAWAGDPTPLEGGLGLMTGIAWLFVVQMLVLVPGVVLVAIDFLGHFRWRRFFGLTPPVDDGFRLWPPAVAAVAGFGIANAGMGAATIRLTDFLDRDGSTVTFGSAAGANLASPGLAVDIFVVGVAVGLVLLMAPMLRGFLTSAYESGVAADYPGAASAMRKRFLKKVARARIVSHVGRNADRFLTGLAIGIALAATVVFVRLVRDPSLERFADTVKPFLGFGRNAGSWAEAIRQTASLALLLYVFPGALIVRAGARNQGTRRQVGKVWDSITFFPRRFHPLGPPCYAERAVPMLREYFRSRAAAGERVVIRAHSQGTVLSVAALSQLVGEAASPAAWTVHGAQVPGGAAGGEEGRTVYADMTQDHQPVGAEVAGALALVTMGSPLGTLHGPFFPGYFSRRGYEDIRAALSNRWENYYRETDYIGKALFVDPGAELTIHGLFAGGPPMRPGSPDHSILDPLEAFGAIRAHSGYPDDEKVKAAIDAYVRGFAPRDR